MRFLIPADKTALCLRAFIIKILLLSEKNGTPKAGVPQKPKRDLSVVVEIKTIKGYLTERNIQLFNIFIRECVNEAVRLFASFCSKDKGYIAD